MPFCEQYMLALAIEDSQRGTINTKPLQLKQIEHVISRIVAVCSLYEINK